MSCGYALVALADRLDKLAEEARARAKPGASSDGWPPGYWAGVAFGLETAAQKVRELVSNDA